MVKIEDITTHGKTTRITEYDTLTDIMAIINANDQFHDGSIEYIEHNAEYTTVGFKHYNDGEHKIQRIVFTGNVDLVLDLDLLVRYILEIRFDISNQTEVIFDGTGINVKADDIKLIVQELI